MEPVINVGYVPPVSQTHSAAKTSIEVKKKQAVLSQPTLEVKNNLIEVKEATEIEYKMPQKEETNEQIKS